ncbi:Rne/Rng family ribonuclease [Hydrogenivirga sp. 128-5-R1-1]|uniref:Rne/Rng family ribonuclease n=1 Tax=Hydrogenivirga sp. 128-5-R1-1 TaxID=392423 RepID=UPI00015F0BD8|nr:Rne/Rng family ribonuclease [Hydrogenivirga sp. 128-5-R1-1]EDP75909.1 cytoplasmic axial filament protein [Hydrogenivirga sp. 128-5-R1-1]
MDVRLIISASRNLVLTFLLKEKEISEIKVEKRGKKRLSGSIFKGRVKRFAKSLDGAFVDIGIGKEAYLPLKAYENTALEEDESCPLPEEGSEILVQMKREPIEDKGAKVTCRISIPGKFLVYLPTSKKVFVSSKIEDENRRAFFKELFERALDEEGVIVRTSAEFATEEELLAELQKLRNTWKEIKERSASIKQGLVYEEVPAYVQLVRDYWNDVSEIIVDDRELWSELLAELESYFPELVGKVRYVKNISVFFKKYGLDKALTRLFARYVWLRNGGYIIIEETEAMTVIDVNSGSGCGDTLEDNALQTNLEAAEEIVRQIKLRDIGGIVIIDFIDMKNKKNREKLVKRVKELFADEGSKVHVYGITHLGLLELTRKKETPSVTRLLSINCPYCKGKGYIKSPEVVLYEIEKEINYFKGRYLEVRVNPALKERVENLIEKSNMRQWVSVKEECDVPLDYYEMFLTG